MLTSSPQKIAHDGRGELIKIISRYDSVAVIFGYDSTNDNEMGKETRFINS